MGRKKPEGLIHTIAQGERSVALGKDVHCANPERVQHRGTQEGKGRNLLCPFRARRIINRFPGRRFACPGLAHVESFQDSFAPESSGFCLGCPGVGRNQAIQISVNLLANSGDAPNIAFVWADFEGACMSCGRLFRFTAPALRGGPCQSGSHHIASSIFKGRKARPNRGETQRPEPQPRQSGDWRSRREFWSQSAKLHQNTLSFSSFPRKRG
jgi:hypothetical protein